MTYSSRSRRFSVTLLKSSARRLATAPFAIAFVAVLVVVAVFLPGLRPSVSVQFHLDTEWAIPLQVFYTGEASVPFQEKQSVRQWVRPGQSIVKVRLPIHTLSALRIDFGQNPGRFHAGRIRVAGRSATVLGWDEFIPSPDVEECSVDSSGVLRAFSKRVDPFFVCTNPLGIRASFPYVGILRLFFAVLLVLALLDVDACFSGSRDILGEFFSRWWTFFRVPVGHALRPLFALRPDGRFVVFMVIVLVAGWGFELANFTMTFDDETILFHPPRELWIGQGRWILFLIDNLLYNVAAPGIALSITLALYAMSFCVLFGRFGRDRYVLFPLYAVFPMLFQSFSFSSLNPGIGLGFLAAAMAARMVFERGTLSVFVGIAFGCIALGTYQVFLVYMAIAMAFLALARIVRSPFFLQRDVLLRFIGRALFVAIGSVAAYQTIQSLFVTSMGGIADDFVRNTYVHPIGGLEDLSRWIGLMVGKTVAILTGHPVFFPFRLWTLGAMTTIVPLASLWCLFAWRRSLFSKFAIAMGLSILAFLPFSPDVVNRSAGIPCRVIAVLLPAAIASFVAIALRIASQTRRFRFVIYALCATAGFQFCWVLNLETYSNVLQNRWDANFANELKARISALPEVARLEAEEREIPLTVVGYCQFDRSSRPPNSRNGWPQWEFESIGRSTFAVPKRFADTLRLHTGERFRYIPNDEISKDVRSFTDGMPVWPQNGSVAWCDGMVVIKFEENRK